MNEAQVQLHQYLEMIHRAFSKPREGFHYMSCADFLLQEGKWYDPVPFPKHVPQGAAKMCFGNAIMLAGLRPGWKYVEGYANAVIPVHHAWNVDHHGQLVDSTWLNIGTAYFGVEFSVERADEATWDGDASILDDWMREWPIFREKWKGETRENAVPASERIRLLRKRNLPALYRLMQQG